MSTYKSIFSHFMVPGDRSSSISPVSYLSRDEVSNGSETKGVDRTNGFRTKKAFYWHVNLPLTF